ncbi:MAG: class I SAM-dependent methyltransferase [Pseudonocardiaceae bacterium]
MTITNHHANYPGFAGVTGLLTGFIMTMAGGSTARLVADLADLSAADRVIDVGCGPGTAVREAARRGARAIGVDPAPVMLRLAGTLTRDRAAVTWAAGTAEDLRQPDGSATVLWSIATVHHWSDVTAGLAEARRVLAPGGRLFAIERRVRPGATGLASHGWTNQQAQAFAAQCRAAGFDDVRVERHTPGRRAVYVVRAIRPRPVHHGDEANALADPDGRGTNRHDW